MFPSSRFHRAGGPRSSEKGPDRSPNPGRAGKAARPTAPSPAACGTAAPRRLVPHTARRRRSADALKPPWRNTNLRRNVTKRSKQKTPLPCPLFSLTGMRAWSSSWPGRPTSGSCRRSCSPTPTTTGGYGGRCPGPPGRCQGRQPTDRRRQGRRVAAADPLCRRGSLGPTAGRRPDRGPAEADRSLRPVPAPATRPATRPTCMPSSCGPWRGMSTPADDPRFMTAAESAVGAGPHRGPAGLGDRGPRPDPRRNCRSAERRRSRVRVAAMKTLSVQQASRRAGVLDHRPPRRRSPGPAGRRARPGRLDDSTSGAVLADLLKDLPN